MTTKHLLGNKFRLGKAPWNKGKKGVQVVSDYTRELNRVRMIGNTYAKDRRTGDRYNEWRSFIFERDSWTCQTCHKRGVYLEAHHIKSWAHFQDLRYDTNNGVTLCRDCHALTDNYRGKNVQSNISNDKDNADEEEDTSSAGGNLSE